MGLWSQQRPWLGAADRVGPVSDRQGVASRRPKAARHLRRGRREYAAVRGNVLDQKLHLVCEDPPVGEDQVLGLVRHVGSVDELQTGLLRKAVALDAVA